MMNNKILEKSLSYIWWHSSRFWEWFHFLHCKTCHLHKRSVRIIIKVLGSLFFYCTFLIFVCGLWISSLGLVSQYDVCATLWLWWEFFNRMSGLLHVILSYWFRKISMGKWARITWLWSWIFLGPPQTFKIKNFAKNIVEKLSMLDVCRSHGYVLVYRNYGDWVGSVL